MYITQVNNDIFFAQSIIQSSLAVRQPDHDPSYIIVGLSGRETLSLTHTLCFSACLCFTGVSTFFSAASDSSACFLLYLLELFIFGFKQ